MVKRRYIGTARNESARLCGDVLERTLDSVINIGEDAGPSVTLIGAPVPVTGSPRTQAGRFLVDRMVVRSSFTADNLADQMLVADIDHFHHGKVTGVFYGDNRTVDRIDRVVQAFHLVLGSLFAGQSVKPLCSIKYGFWSASFCANVSS